MNANILNVLCLKTAYNVPREITEEILNKYLEPEAHIIPIAFNALF